MVNGPGTVIFVLRVVCALAGTAGPRPRPACLRRILPTMRGTGFGWPERSSARARVVEVDALERGGEAVGVALAADLAVGDDVEAGLLLRADGEQRRVVLRLGEVRLGDAPELAARARAAESARRASCGRSATRAAGSCRRAWSGKSIASGSVDEFRGNLRSAARGRCARSAEYSSRRSRAAASFMCSAKRSYQAPLASAAATSFSTIGRRAASNAASAAAIVAGLRARALSSAMASSMASRVPEPMEKCAVRSASPISTHVAGRPALVAQVRESCARSTCSTPAAGPRACREHPLAVGRGSPPRPSRAKPARSQVAASHSTTKVLMSRRVAVVMRVESAVLVLDEGLRQRVETLRACRTRRTCSCRCVTLVPKSRRARAPPSWRHRAATTRS